MVRGCKKLCKYCSFYKVKVCMNTKSTNYNKNLGMNNTCDYHTFLWAAEGHREPIEAKDIHILGIVRKLKILDGTIHKENETKLI